MAFETNLIALTMSNGAYKVHSYIVGHVDTIRMEKEKLFRDVSGDTGYADFATIFSKRDFEKYLYEDGEYHAEPARGWYKGLSKEVDFIIVHRAEWESGLGD